mmetsp:Transcript_72512/g.172891  ORF Transcript_72512/g.172891 Transcript_72512/m.172891 type:complete len:312 (-) Transcript_72512:148-1083(-)|eukprot:CAMPEP_0178431642 /NCGR_PEP_ID=MMETSP0689_2-20121128/31961_1 /TAXON_ID=160604 /ORGANISM="Amphidinium massartii, Strain CS-259" /LENGTH=311 /DNA_ID=CAMNT_0020053577 /DNA_START=98 /DNA_END=1033 /DNA_ORIENTATION=-
MSSAVRSRKSSKLASLLVAAVAIVAASQLLAAAFVAFPKLTGNALSTESRRSSRVVMEAAGMDTDSVKANLLSLLDDEELAKEVLRPDGKPIRGRLDELIVQMERKNPTEEPVFSEQLDGSWEVKYSGSYAPGLLSSPTRELALFLYGGGFSLGNALASFSSGAWGRRIGVKVLKQSVRIVNGQTVDAFADVDAFGQVSSLSYQAELTPLSGARMSEEVTMVELPEPVGTINPPLELRRTILVTYLDDDMMIVRDESGVPEVLLREEIDEVIEHFVEKAASNATEASANASTSAVLDAEDNETETDTEESG